MRTVEAAHQARRRAARGDHVDAQRTAAGAHGRDRALGDAQQLARVGQERLPVDGERRAPRAVRVNSRTPRLRSSAAMRLETACWVTASSAAASWNWPASAATTKVRTESR